MTKRAVDYRYMSLAATTFAGRRRNRSREEAARLGISERQLRDWRAEGVIPFLKIGGTILFDPDRVDQALAAFERNSKAATK
jgi:excisionase family DNA binding protein